MTRFYVEFKTWAEGRIEAPWPFVWFEETADYRRRDDLTVIVPISSIKNTFLGFNDQKAQKFLTDHVAAVILGAVIEVDSIDAIAPHICNIFGSCEVLGQCEITESNQASIDAVMANAGVTPGVSTAA